MNDGHSAGDVKREDVNQENSVPSRRKALCEKQGLAELR